MQDLDVLFLEFSVLRFRVIDRYFVFPLLMTSFASIGYSSFEFNAFCVSSSQCLVPTITKVLFFATTVNIPTTAQGDSLSQ